MSKGVILHQMPEEIYKKNRRSGLFSQYFGLGIIIFGLSLSFFCLFFVDGGEQASIFIGICVLIGYGIILSELKDEPINRFTIYENGYIPAVKPLIYYLKRKEYFISFNIINDIEFVVWGERCNLYLKNGKKEQVKDWHDIEGYLKFTDVIKKYMPNKKYPNFNIVTNSFYANQDHNNKKISLEEFNEIYRRQMEINKDFGPKI